MSDLVDRADKALETIPLEKPVGWSAFSVFVAGDDRPFPWPKLALPAVLLWSPEWGTP